MDGTGLLKIVFCAKRMQPEVHGKNVYSALANEQTNTSLDEFISTFS